MSIRDFNCPGIAFVNDVARLPAPASAELFSLSNEAPAVCNPDTTPEPLTAFLTALVAVVAADVMSNAILLIT